MAKVGGRPAADAMNHFLNGATSQEDNEMSPWERITRQHFYHHGKPDADEEEKRKCHLCQIRSFKNHATIPISIHNDTDDGAVLNPDFRFIDRKIAAKDVPMADASFKAGCICKHDEDCMYSNCHCLDEIEVSDSDPDTVNGEVDGQFYNSHGTSTRPPHSRLAKDRPKNKRRKKVIAYHAYGQKAGLLRSQMLHSRDAIYECHDLCSCSRDCPNRVVERGRTVPLEIFRTEDRGWGVRCPVEIKKGQFVDLYVGEVITSQEADRRRQASNIARRKDVYLFALDKFTDPESPSELLRGPPLEVDGEYMSGPTRFVNHSCDPNMRIFARVGDHADKHVHDLALFAIKDIEKGVELTFDYVDGLEEMDRDAHDPARVKDMTECLCGTDKCRGFLW
ncbi:histone-lysine N-methyltransferase [Naviculisporaceae sp. PSN 640]